MDPDRLFEVSVSDGSITSSQVISVPIPDTQYYFLYNGSYSAAWVLQGLIYDFVDNALILWYWNTDTRADTDKKWRKVSLSSNTLLASLVYDFPDMYVYDSIGQIGFGSDGTKGLVFISYTNPADILASIDHDLTLTELTSVANVPFTEILAEDSTADYQYGWLVYDSIRECLWTLQPNEDVVVDYGNSRWERFNLGAPVSNLQVSAAQFAVPTLSNLRISDVALLLPGGSALRVSDAGLQVADVVSTTPLTGAGKIYSLNSNFVNISYPLPPPKVLNPMMLLASSSELRFSYDFPDSDFHDIWRIVIKAISASTGEEVVVKNYIWSYDSFHRIESILKTDILSFPKDGYISIQTYNLLGETQGPVLLNYVHTKARITNLRVDAATHNVLWDVAEGKPTKFYIRLEGQDGWTNPSLPSKLVPAPVFDKFDNGYFTGSFDIWYKFTYVSDGSLAGYLPGTPLAETMLGMPCKVEVRNATGIGIRFLPPTIPDEWVGKVVGYHIWNAITTPGGAEPTRYYRKDAGSNYHDPNGWQTPGDVPNGYWDKPELIWMFYMGMDIAYWAADYYECVSKYGQYLPPSSDQSLLPTYIPAVANHPDTVTYVKEDWTNATSYSLDSPSTNFTNERLITVIPFDGDEEGYGQTITHPAQT
jgi:hypothetical protein